MANYVQKSTDEEVGRMLVDIIMVADDEETQERTGRWNAKFETAPTRLQAEDWIYRVWTIGGMQMKKKKEERQRRMIKQLAPELIISKLITFAIDQKKTEEQITQEYCESIVNELRKASKYESYKYLRGSNLRFEFYTEGDKFNPHCHIETQSDMKNTEMAQLFRRKFMPEKNPKKWDIYRVNVVERNAEITFEYVIEGNKKEAKMPHVLKDNKFKLSKNIDILYVI